MPRCELKVMKAIGVTKLVRRKWGRLMTWLRKMQRHSSERWPAASADAFALQLATPACLCLRLVQLGIARRIRQP